MLTVPPPKRPPEESGSASGGTAVPTALQVPDVIESVVVEPVCENRPGFSDVSCDSEVSSQKKMRRIW